MIEITAVPINHLWSTRFIIRNRFTRSNNAYDDDFNVWLRDRDLDGRMQVYMLDPSEVARMPCAQLEQLIHHMSIDHHQALLVLHIALQGKFNVRLFRL